MSDAAGETPFLPYAKYVWNAPFWVPAIHLPFPPEARRANLETLREGLVAAAPCRGIRRWHVEDLSGSAEPWRLQLRMRHRLVAELEEDAALLGHLRECLGAHGFGRLIEVSHLQGRLYYEEFGLGCVEYQLGLALTDGHARQRFAEFLMHEPFWSSVDFTGLLEGGRFRVQQGWPCLRSAMQRAIERSGGARRFAEMEDFVTLKRGAVTGGTGRGPRSGRSGRPARDDDFAWTYCMDLVLFRDRAFELTEDSLDQLASTLHAIGNTIDAKTDPRRLKSDSGEPITGYARTTSCLLTLDEGSTIDLCYSGFGMVALVSEGDPFGERASAASGTGGASPSARVAALRRRALMNYAALTEAADGLRAYLSTILFAEENEAPDRHEQLRRIVAALAMVQYDARREVVEADDTETLIYGCLSEAWGLGNQSAVLTELVENADRATARISETNVQTEERSLNRIVVFLAIITLASTVQDFAAFVLEPRDPSRWEGQLILLHVALLGLVWFLAFRLIRRHRVLTPVRRRGR